jgi:uncharacterized protein
MPERTEYPPGSPSWVDLQTSDIAKAKQFYGQLFGWTYDDQPIPDTDAVYSMAQKSGKDVAAIAGMPPGSEGMPPHWNTYVTVSDVDATAATVPGAGGSVVAPPFDVLDAGRMAVFQDPTGAFINAWQAKNHIGASLVNEHGTLTWNELMSPDVEKAGEFYRAIFGWQTKKASDGPMEYWEFQLNGQSIAGGMKPPMEGIPANWGVYFAVDDCDDTVAKAKQLGASVFAEPMDIPVGRFAALADPTGAMFSVIKLAEPPS